MYAYGSLFEERVFVFPAEAVDAAAPHFAAAGTYYIYVVLCIHRDGCARGPTDGRHFEFFLQPGVTVVATQIEAAKTAVALLASEQQCVIIAGEGVVLKCGEMAAAVGIEWEVDPPEGVRSREVEVALPQHGLIATQSQHNGFLVVLTHGGGKHEAGVLVQRQRSRGVEGIGCPGLSAVGAAHQACAREGQEVFRAAAHKLRETVRPTSGIHGGPVDAVFARHELVAGQGKETIAVAHHGMNIERCGREDVACPLLRTGGIGGEYHGHGAFKAESIERGLYGEGVELTHGAEGGESAGRALPYHGVAPFFVNADVHLIFSVGNAIGGIYRDDARRREIDGVFLIQEGILPRYLRLYRHRSRGRKSRKHDFLSISAHGQRIHVEDALVHLVDGQRIERSRHLDGIDRVAPTAGERMEMTIECAERHRLHQASPRRQVLHFAFRITADIGHQHE